MSHKIIINDNGISSSPDGQMKSLWSILTLTLYCFRVRENGDVFLQGPTRPEVLGTIQYYHDVTHT